MSTLLYKNISLTLYSRKGWCFCGVWEMSGETYTKRDDLFFPYLLPGASGCERLHPLQARQRHLWSAACHSLDCDSQHSVQIWPRGSLVSFRLHTCCNRVLWLRFCLLIKMWQLAKAYGVTRNEPKIHVICYIYNYMVSDISSYLIITVKTLFELIPIEKLWTRNSLIFYYSLLLGTYNLMQAVRFYLGRSWLLKSKLHCL